MSDMTTEKEMRDDFSRLKTMCRLVILGEMSHHEMMMEAYKMSMKHAHGYYPEEESSDT